MYDHIGPNRYEPPGTFREIIDHPGGKQRVIEKANMMEHRFAFFYWLKWYRTLAEKKWLQQSAPTLVTIDWHRDMAPPSDELKEKLLKLRADNLSEIANFVWEQFDQTNDGHILCAVWLNIIGDVLLLKHSAGDLQDTYKDYRGDLHRIYEFRSYTQFQEFLLSRDDANVFLDIDLDYFIHGKGNIFYPDTFKPFSDEEIRETVDPQNPAFEHLLPAVDGLTIALEPAYTGGIFNSSRIMQVVQEQLFTKNNCWRHLNPVWQRNETE